MPTSSSPSHTTTRGTPRAAAQPARQPCDLEQRVEAAEDHCSPEQPVATINLLAASSFGRPAPRRRCGPPK
eukprot:12366747-Alexandrium_andersonii.AAC.1